MQLMTFPLITILSLLLFSGGSTLCLAQKDTDPYKTKNEKKDGQTTPIEDALISAYMTNSNLQAKLHEQYARHETINQAFSGFRPSVAASGQLSRQKTDAKNSQGKNDFTVSPRQNGVEVAQNLYTGGGTIASIRSAEFGVEAGHYDLINTEQTTFFNAAQAYLNVIFRKAALAFNNANVTFLSESLKGVRAAVEVGEKTRTDVAQAESRLAEGMANLSAAEGEYHTALANYLQVIGKEPGILTYPASLPNLPHSMEELIELALKASPAVLSAEYNLEKSKSDVDVASSELLPKVDLTGSANRTAEQTRLKDKTNTYTGTLRLSVPIYQKGAEWSTIRQRTETQAQLRYQLEQARKSAREEAIKAWEGWTSAIKRTESFRKQVEFATISRDGAVLEAEVGERSYLDVLDAQRELLNAQTGLEQAKRDERLAEYQIYAVMGRLTSDFLDLPVQRYDEEGHLKSVRYQILGYGPQTVKDE